MTARSAQSHARWALGVLVAVVMSLAVLAHHALTGPTMGPMSDSDTSMSSMAAFASPPADRGTEAMAPHSVAAHTPAPATAAMVTCGSEAMCTAAGIAGSPFPAALPQATSIAAAACPSARVKPLPPGTGPPLPADTTSVLLL